jgi:hypothetical protein
MPPPNHLGTTRTVNGTMTKILRLTKRYRRARARWSPKRLELGAIPA